MKRSLIVLAAAGFFALILAVALLGLRASQSGSGNTAFADDIPFTAVIDADADNGTGPCAPVDATAEVVVSGSGTTHHVALCLINVPSANHIGAFTAGITYDPEKNECPNITCASGCLDDNPNVNSSADPASWAPGLGDPDDGDWTCTPLGLGAPPLCDATSTSGLPEAYAACSASTGPYTSPVASQTAWPLMVVTFNAIQAGTVDTLGIEDLLIGEPSGAEQGSCNPETPGSDPLPCTGAEVDKVAPSPTPPPTDTPTPMPPTDTPTPTPVTPTATSTPVTPTATPTPYADIDKIKDGNTWCNPVQATSTEYVGSSHQLAICVHNMPEAVQGFELSINYDGALDGCTETECADDVCLDDNPDANVGTTTWSGGLGTAWDCDIEGEPVCNEEILFTAGAAPTDGGLASIWCQSDGGGILQSGPLAVLDLDVLAAGTDHVSINSLVVEGSDYVIMAECFAQDGVLTSATIADGGFVMDCNPATDVKVPPPSRKRPTATPTEMPTATPTQVAPTQPPPPPPPLPTATPYGGVGPEITAPPTGSGPAGGGSAWILWLLAGTAGAAAAGGVYLRFGRGLRRSSSR
jgi:hypothetical protein